jgi:HEAT repeat protein
VAEALEKWADPATVEPLIHAAAAGSREAVALLTKLEPDAACRALPCLKGADRIAAAVALLQAGRAEALPAALDGLRHLDEHKDTLESCQAALPELESFFERHAFEAADAVLRDASDLSSVVITRIAEGCGYYGGGGSYETKVDTSRIRQLARQELIRRDPVASACAAGEWETVIGFGEAALPALTWLLTISEKTQWPKIVRAIGRIGGPQATGLVLEALRDVDADVRAAAAHALARLKEPSTADALVVALQDRHKDVRLAASKALSALGPPAIPSLKPALGNKDHAIRRAAMEVLARFVDPAGSELLAKGLRDSDAGVRKLACEALVAIGKPAIPALQTVLRASNRAAVAVASEILARLGWNPSDPKDRDRFAIGQRQFQQASSDALLALAAEPQDRDAIARLDGACTVAEVEALGLMADTRAVEPLIALLRQSRDSRTGEEAAAALGRIGDIRAVDALIAAIDSKAVGRAMGALIKLLETKAADFSEPQLRTLAGRVTITIGTGQMICATGVEESRSVECSPRLSQLARQELLRRGLEG